MAVMQTLANIKMRTSAIFIGLIIFITIPRIGNSCSCIDLSSVKEQYDSSDFVAIGKVIDLKTVYEPDSSKIKELIEDGINLEDIHKKFTGIYVTQVTMVIDTVYKGIELRDTIKIYTESDPAACGYPFYSGRKYIVYGYYELYTESEAPDRKEIWTGLCTRTQEYNQKEKREIEKLKK